MSNLSKMELTEEAQLGHQHMANSLAIASLLSSLSESQSTEQYHLSLDCQSQKSTKTSVERLGAKNVKGSWIFSASDEYLAMLDKAGVIPMVRTYRVNDYGGRWAD